MPKLIFDFGKGRKERSVSVVALAIDLAILELGTAKSVCTKLDVSRNTLTRWRTGEVKPRPGNLRALASLADIPIHWLVKY